MALASTTAAYTLIGMATKFQEFFYGEAGDVTFDYMDVDGNRLTTSVPNVAKLSDTIQAGSVNVVTLENGDTITPGTINLLPTLEDIKVSLPADPVNGYVVFISDRDNNAQNVTAELDRNGSLINDDEENLFLDTNKFDICLVYSEENTSWYVAE